MELAYLGVLPFLVALLNRVRGGWLFSGGASAYVAAAALAALVFAATFDPIAAGAFLVTYIIGESFGWGKWIGMIPNWYDKAYTQTDYLASPAYARDDGRNNGVHFLANKMARERDDFRAYGWWALVFRGGLWWALPLVALAVTGSIPWIIAILGIPVLAFAFPVIYSLSFKMFGNKYWGMGELLYGLAQGAVLSVGFLLQ